MADAPQPGTPLVDVVGNRARLVAGSRVGVTVPDPDMPAAALTVAPDRSARLMQAA